DPSGKGGAEVRKRGGMKFGVGCNPGALLEGKHRFRSHCWEDYATVISMRFRALHFEVTVPGGEQAVGVGLNPREPSSSRGPSILEREHLESAVALDERRREVEAHLLGRGGVLRGDLHLAVEREIAVRDGRPAVDSYEFEIATAETSRRAADTGVALNARHFPCVVRRDVGYRPALREFPP